MVLSVFAHRLEDGRKGTGMTDRYGDNHEQVESFLDVACSLQFEFVEPIVAETRSQEVRDAQDALFAVRFSAARHSAVESASRTLVRTLREEFPTPTTAAERVVLNSFTGMLNSAVFAFASRPVVGDETVGLVVDPFASRLGFEWRSWGVSVNGDLEGHRG